MNNFKRYDVIVFNEHDKVVVLASTMLDGIEYLYVNKITDDEQNVTDEYDILKVDCSDATLESVEDKTILATLLSTFDVMLREEE